MAVFVSSRNSPRAWRDETKRLCGRQLIITFSHSPALWLGYVEKTLSRPEPSGHLTWTFSEQKPLRLPYMNSVRAGTRGTTLDEFSSNGNLQDHFTWTLSELEPLKHHTQTISQGKPLGPPYVNSLRAGNPGTHSRCLLKDFCFTNK